MAVTAGRRDQLASALDPIAPRFWAKVQVGSKDECWPWTGSTVGFGHGSYHSPAGHTAHRTAWALANGELPPAGMVVRHRCDNPPCCNPEHLVPGTQADNHRDMVERGRAGYSDRECRNGHPRDESNLFFHANGFPRCRTCIRTADAARRAAPGYRKQCPICGTRVSPPSLARHVRTQHPIAALRVTTDRLDVTQIDKENPDAR